MYDNSSVAGTQGYPTEKSVERLDLSPGPEMQNEKWFEEERRAGEGESPAVSVKTCDCIGSTTTHRPARYLSLSLRVK
jgi:hypothetical protein